MSVSLLCHVIPLFWFEVAQMALKLQLYILWANLKSVCYVDVRVCTGTENFKERGGIKA